MKYKNQLVLTRRLRAIFGVLLTLGNLLAHPGLARTEEGGGFTSANREPGGEFEPEIERKGDPETNGGEDPDRTTGESGAPSGSGVSPGPHESGDSPRPAPDRVVPQPIVGIGVDGSSGNEHPLAEITPKIANPNSGTATFYRDSFAALLMDEASRSQLRPDQIDAMVKAAKDGDIVGFVPVQRDSRGWTYRFSELKTGSPRETLVVEIDGHAARDASSTLKFQKGATDPTVASEVPSVNLGKDRSGESILPGSGNANLPADQIFHPTERNTQTPGLPGLGQDAQITDQDRKPAETWAQVKSKLENYIHDTDLVLTRATVAFKADLFDNHLKLENSSGELLNSANAGKTTHNNMVTDLYARAGLNATPVAMPESPIDTQPELGSPQYPTHVGNYKFLTPQATQAGQKLKSAQYYRDAAAGEISRRPGEHQSARQDMLKAADLGIASADQLYAVGDAINAEQALHVALLCLDIALDIVPGISFVKNSLTIVTGINYITGQEVSNTERAILSAMLVMPSLLSGTAKGLMHSGVIFQKIAKSESAAAGLAGELATVVGKADRSLAAEVAQLEVGSGQIVDGVIQEAVSSGRKGGAQAAEALEDLAVKTGLEAERIVDSAKNYGAGTSETMRDFASWLKKPLANNPERGAIGNSVDKTLEIIKDLRPEQAVLEGAKLFEDVPKSLRSNVWDIMENLPQALKDNPQAKGFINTLRPHELTANLRGWTSLDLVPNNPSASPLRFLFRTETDGTIKWMIKDTH